MSKCPQLLTLYYTSVTWPEAQNNGLVATPVALLVSKYINSYFNSVCIRVLVLLIEPKIQNIQVLFFP